MGVGSQELTRASTTYLMCLCFAVTFLVTTLYGGSPLTAVIRGSVVAIIARVIAPLLLRPVINTILDAMARDTSVSDKTGSEEKG